MKIRILLVLSALVLTGLNIQAQQTLKIGHVNVQELAGKHPAMDSIRAVVEQETKDMEEIYAEMLAEQETKLTAFEKESETYSEFVKNTKQAELIELAQKIQTFNQTAQQQIQQRNMQLIRPIYEEINQEIANIAGGNNFSYILDVSTGSVAYISPESEDITPLVLEALKGK